MKIPVRVFSVIGFVLFIFILTRIDISSLLTIFTSINPALLLLALAVNCVAVVMKSYKWKIIVGTVNNSFSLSESIRAFLIGFSFSVLTPAKLGDFIRAFYVKNENCSTGIALSTVVTDRLIDIVMLVAISSAGIFLFSYVYHIEILSILLLLLMAAGIACAVAVIANKSLLSRILRPFFNLFVPDAMKQKISDYYHEFYEGLFAFYRHRVAFFLAIIIALISWIPPFIYGYLLAASIGIPIGISYFVIIIPIISLLDLLPISISGIGTRDAALIFLFGLQGVTPESAVAFSLLYLFMSYWLVALAGAFFWVKHPIQTDSR
ncbi:MAG: hypothetical protein A4E35_01821 [Methanoregula sp. PtaU1.Bin051]|nr:MAG: hypothetical protein A4E35_01821 [Methanoregula sp. PtaU1.Bin051]